MPPMQNPASDLSGEWGKQWKTWQEMQAGIFKPWMDFWGQALKGSAGQAPGNLEEAASGGQQLYQRWFDYMQEMMSGFGLPREGLGPDAFQRLFESAGIIQKLYSLLGDLYQTYSTVVQEDGQYSFDAMTDKLGAWADEYRRLVSEVIAPLFPEQIRWVPELYSGEFPLMYTGLTMRLSAPWLDLARRLADRQIKGELMAPQPAIHIYEEWRQAWDDSFGRVLRAPMLGYYREAVEKLSHAVNSYAEFNIIQAEFYSSIEEAAMQALQTMQERLGQMQSEKGPEPLSFRDVYSLWWQSNERVYEELFQTEEFGRLLGQVVDRGMQFRADFQSYIEETTKELPFPNRSEMDHLYKAVYQMKHDIRAMSKELSELRGQPAEQGKPQRLKGVS
ncbi:MAG: hypothetical protein A2V52_05845 [Actinobacteria bacterium RBG_19FT_COMBO_54_7]|uniref:Poly(3-hydroxyalkanoate) polymerase subunit PhaE n=1 Tax=Candidatus Solincola sediminis TaxID=1797199 RepID=A0A1F2WSK0_9ACTN|nr:MAG: hypothetical protein A2Y75_10375 [Candidatus Solincola sediminis]OFW60911.1 MAG: hypothetical protein A2W01_12090 [Candidatus Solincola sediminis]OFW68216.1 MAG: hypothetical protein A2V52_05845 [Actinobacteria bacterium RBG_19FT_COMBO_54_7]